MNDKQIYLEKKVGRIVVRDETPICCRNCKHYDWDILGDGFGEHLR